MWQSGIQSYVTHILSFVCMPWILQNKYVVWILSLLPHFVIHYSLSKALQYSHSYMYQEPLVQRNRYFKASACIASVWESSTAATLVVFSWMTITWMLRSPGCKQAKAQGVSGGKITYWFFCAMVPHWFNTQRHIEASNELYQSLDTFLPCLPRHCVSSMFVSKVLGFPLSITNLKHYGVYRKIETFIIDFLMISRLLLCLLWHYLYFLLIFF